MNDLTALDLEMARRALETASAPVFSLAAAIESARKQHLRGEAEPMAPLDPATRPRSAADAALWDRMQKARARVIAYRSQPQSPSTPSESQPEDMTEAELRERIDALRRSQQ